MKTILISLLVSIFVTVAILYGYTDRVVKKVASYYDVYHNSVSGWICTTHEPSTAHPELVWDWKSLSYKITVVCHGIYQDK